MGKFKPNYKLPNVMTPEHTSDEVIQQMQNHVDSYISMSRHNHNCLELCRRLAALEKDNAALEDKNKALRAALDGLHYHHKMYEPLCTKCQSTRGES